MTTHRDQGPRSAPISSAELRRIVDAPGPFASLFLNAGNEAEHRARIAIDRIPVPPPHAGQLLDAIDSLAPLSQVVVVDGNGETTTFEVDDPFALDIARFGEAPSLGPLLEIRQMVAPHAVVTVEDDVFAVTDLGTVASTGDQHHVFEALEHLVDHLRSTDARMVALVGTEKALEPVIDDLRGRLDGLRVVAYPTSDIDRDLMELADQVVRDAASLAAEAQTHELAHFRQARAAGQVVEGGDVLPAVEDGTVQRILVHDAVEPTVGISNRAIDRVIAAAIRHSVPVTMIADVPDDRGPRDGVGGILQGDGAPIRLDEQVPAFARGDEREGQRA